MQPTSKKAINTISTASLLILALITAESVPAEILVGKYKTEGQNESHKSFLDTYILGVGTGYGWASSQMSADYKLSLYCPPEKLPITPEMYRDILDNEIKKPSPEGRPPYPYDTPIEIILLIGLKNMFPCKK